MSYKSTEAWLRCAALLLCTVLFRSPERFLSTVLPLGAVHFLDTAFHRAFPCPHSHSRRLDVLHVVAQGLPSLRVADGHLQARLGPPVNPTKCAMYEYAIYVQPSAVYPCRLEGTRFLPTYYSRTILAILIHAVLSTTYPFCSLNYVRIVERNIHSS